MDQTRRLRVFLCHSSADKPMVRDLYKLLSSELWIDPWLDEVTIKPGQDWQSEIEKAVNQTDVVIVCLSQNSITKEGYIQKEIRKALDKAEEKPEDTIFIIPLRFEECDVPRRLAKWHWVDYFREDWYSRLIGSLRSQGESLGISLMTSDGQEPIVTELQDIKKSLAMKETELKAILAQADEITHTDDLTFLPNRRRILGDLQHEVMFSERYGTPLSISMLELDNFKQINDTYGHLIGDEVLRNLAILLRELIRHPDTIGRYGGEEFLLVLPHTTIDAAGELAEKLCQQVRVTPIVSNKHTFQSTISVGVTKYKIHEEDWNGLLERVDQALYQAKNNGRDQWVIAES